ncbi:hypothetical protein BN1723_019899, partial [Verticillium longisporum]
TAAPAWQWWARTASR